MDDRKSNMIAMLEKGMSNKEIAEAMDMTPQGVWDYCKRHGLSAEPNTILLDRDERQNEIKVGSKLLRPTAMIGVPVTQAEADALLEFDLDQIKSLVVRTALEDVIARLKMRMWRFGGAEAKR